MPGTFYIYPKDIQKLTGLTLRRAQELHKKVLAFSKKRKYLSVNDWCIYNGDKVVDIKKELNIK